MFSTNEVKYGEGILVHNLYQTDQYQSILYPYNILYSYVSANMVSDIENGSTFELKNPFTFNSDSGSYFCYEYVLLDQSGNPIEDPWYSLKVNHTDTGKLILQDWKALSSIPDFSVSNDRSYRIRLIKKMTPLTSFIDTVDPYVKILDVCHQDASLDLWSPHRITVSDRNVMTKPISIGKKP